MNIEKLIKEQNAKVIDVRSQGEFMSGNVQGSINIPLQEIPQRIEDIKALNSPVILCCASGNRSGQAHHYLSQQGIECYNGGSWYEVNAIS
jgi:rhodanese-related sulfurtransferase